MTMNLNRLKDFFARGRLERAEPGVALERTNVLILYGNLECGLHARRMLGQLARGLPLAVPFDLEVCRLDLLEVLFRSREEAVSDLFDRDIIVLSVDEATLLALTPEIDLNACFSGKADYRRALVLSLRSEGRDCAKVEEKRNELRIFAQRRGADFFEQSEDEIPGARQPTSNGERDASNSLQNPSLTGIPDRVFSYHHGGINE